MLRSVLGGKFAAGAAGRGRRPDGSNVPIAGIHRGSQNSRSRPGAVSCKSLLSMHAYIGMAAGRGGTQLLRVPRAAARPSSFTFAIASPRIPLPAPIPSTKWMHGRTLAVDGGS